MNPDEADVDSIIRLALNKPVEMSLAEFTVHYQHIRFFKQPTGKILATYESSEELEEFINAIVKRKGVEFVVIDTDLFLQNKGRNVQGFITFMFKSDPRLGTPAKHLDTLNI